MFYFTHTHTVMISSTLTQLLSTCLSGGRTHVDKPVASDLRSTIPEHRAHTPHSGLLHCAAAPTCTTLTGALTRFVLAQLNQDLKFQFVCIWCGNKNFKVIIGSQDQICPKFIPKTVTKKSVYLLRRQGSKGKKLSSGLVLVVTLLPPAELRRTGSP